MTRLRVELVDTARIDETALARLGAQGVMRFSSNLVHIVLGTNADALATALKKAAAHDDATRPISRAARAPLALRLVFRPFRAQHSGYRLQATTLRIRIRPDFRLVLQLDPRPTRRAPRGLPPRARFRRRRGPSRGAPRSGAAPRDCGRSRAR